MSVTETLKRYILDDCGLDAVGIAPASALEDERGGHRPEDILPGAKSIIVFLKKIPDGIIQAAFRAKEDGHADAFSIYASYGRELTPNMHLFFMQYNIAQYIERNFGFTAVPVSSGPMQNVTPVNIPLPTFTGAKANTTILDPVRAAVAAGLGEIAWNNAFVTEENGPRQGIGLVLTTLELDYDSPYDGPKLCNPEKCGICIRLCPTKAIPEAGGKTEEFMICDKVYNVSCVNANACAVASMAFRQEFAGKYKVPNQILTDDPTDEELKKAYAEKPIASWSFSHYPDYYCDVCRRYCPLGHWKERFSDTGFSSFDVKEAGK